MLTFTGGMINAMQTTMFALAAHVYPTAMRATGVGTAVVDSAGRARSSAATPAPWALELRGSTSFFGLMAAALCVTFVALAAVRERHVPARKPDLDSSRLCQLISCISPTPLVAVAATSSSFCR